MIKSFVFILLGFAFLAFSCSSSPQGNNNATTNGVAEQKLLAEPEAEVLELMQKYTCVSCHKTNTKLVGPSWKEIADRNYSEERMLELIKKPEPANWPGYPPMLAIDINNADASKIINWINSLNN